MVPVGRSTSRSLPPRWPWWLSSDVVAVVRRSSKGRSDRLLLVSPPRAQPSLPPTLGSSHHGLPARLSHGTRLHLEKRKRLVVVVVCVVQMIQSTPCLSRVMPTMHLIGWQNTWEQLPASPPPLPRPDGGGTLAVYLCTRPKKDKPDTNCRASTVYCIVWTMRTCGTCEAAQQGRRPPHVRHLEESLWSSTCKTMGTSLCAATGMSTT